DGAGPGGAGRDGGDVQPPRGEGGGVRSRGAGRLRDDGPGPAEEPLGDADRGAAVLRVPAADGGDVHLHGAGGGRADARADEVRAADGEPVRGGRDHVRERAVDRLPGGLWPDNRDGVRADRGDGGGQAWPRLTSSATPSGSSRSATRAATVRATA